jgi:polyisoprenoid-binding protein YceI
MTNYLKALAAVLLAAGGARAADVPRLAASATSYVLAPGDNHLDFTFVQEGAATPASFKQFAVSFVYDPQNLAASKLDVKVQATSVFTDYEDRDGEIREANILDVVKFPSIEYHATSLVKSATGVDAVGKLSVHGVTRDLRIPLVIKPVSAAGKNGLELTGSTQVKRLDFGVGQGEWAATDTVGNEIRISWKVTVIPVAH